MTTLNARAFTLRSGLQLPADHYEAEVEGVSAYLTADPADRVNLVAGYKDETDTAHTVGVLTGGIIDEYVLTGSKAEIVAQIRGRDQCAFLLDKKFNYRFIHYPAPVAVTTDGSEDPASPDFVPSTVGIFTASAIAKAICDGVGLKLRWEAPDYTWQTDFAASGRAIDSIGQLVAPFQLTEPYKVDIMLIKDTLIVRERTPVSVADPINTFTVKDARIEGLTIRRKRPIKYGKITLRGANVVPTGPQGLTSTPLAEGGQALAGGSQTVRNSKETKDGNGNTVARVVEEVTYRMPDQIVLDVHKWVYDSRNLISEEITNNVWQPSSYSTQGPTNRPVQKHQDTLWKGFAPGSNFGGMVEIKREKTSFTYDGGGFLTDTAKLTSTRNAKTGALEETDLQTVSYRTEGPLFIKQTTENFRKGTVKGQSAKSWISSSTVVQVSAGHRPGGPGRNPSPAGPPGQPSLAANASHETEHRVVLSSDLDAVDIDQSFPQMDASGLAIIADRLTRSHGLVEYEAEFQGVAIPWVLRGVAIHFTGYATVDGATPIPLQPLLVYELRMVYSESRGAISLVSNVKGVYWI